MEHLDLVHQQISDCLRGDGFKRDAAGKSGEMLKIVVADAILRAQIGVEVVSVGLANPTVHAASPYEAVWQRYPGAAIERSYFNV